MKQILDINSYAGLGTESRYLAALLAIIMFSLAGIPPFAGFFGKYYIFIAAIKSDLTWLAILGVFQVQLAFIFICELLY